MNSSHKRRTGPGAPNNRKPDVVARAKAKEFIVLRMCEQYAGGPKHAVASEGNASAHFFSEDDAQAYAKWRNKP